MIYFTTRVAFLVAAIASGVRHRDRVARSALTANFHALAADSNLHVVRVKAQILI
jgi:hypothetical protein